MRMHARSVSARRARAAANYTTTIPTCWRRWPAWRPDAIGRPDQANNGYDVALERLHAAGMRGVRFNFVRMSRWHRGPRLLQARSSGLPSSGWYIKIFIGPEELPRHDRDAARHPPAAGRDRHMAASSLRTGRQPATTWCGTCCGERISGSCCPTGAHVGAAERLR